MRQETEALESQRGALNDDQVQHHRDRVEDLENQLEEHRQALRNLGASSRSTGQIAALDRVNEQLGTPLRREIVRTHTPQAARLAQQRRRFALQIWEQIRRSWSSRADRSQDITLEQSQGVLDLLRASILDEVFGASALARLDRETRSGSVRPTVRRGGRDRRPSYSRLLDALMRRLTAIDQDRQSRGRSTSSAEQEALAYRQRAGAEEGNGTVAGGELVLDSAADQGQLQDSRFTGASRRALAEGDSIDTTYRPRRRDNGQPSTNAQAIDHAEQTVLGRAARAIRASMGSQASSASGELRMFVEGPSCQNCLGGLPVSGGAPGAVVPAFGADGPILQFSQDFPQMRLVISFPATAGGSMASMVIKNGQILNGEIRYNSSTNRYEFVPTT